MYVKKSILHPFILILTALVAIVLFAGCDAVDTLFTSADTYKINAYIGDLPMNERSFISFGDEITPFFEEPVSKDPDITSLIISIQKPAQKPFQKPAEEDSEVVAIYTLENEIEQDDESLIQARSVKNMDTDLTSFTIPEDFEMGLYAMVFEIMGGEDVLQRTEKNIYYLGDTAFSYEGIAVHLPGISDNPHLISKGQVILLEAELNFDLILDPYIIWYNGKNKITEGYYSKGAGLLLWKAPEQSNFYSLRAEVFPVYDYETLAGYQKEVSILVSSKTTDVNLISDDIPELLNWYVFEGNLQDSKNPVQNENNNAAWVPFNGTYGLGTGNGKYFTLPKSFIPAGGDSWQILFRFVPLNNGSVLTVNFGAALNAVIDLSINDNLLELSLSSSSNSVTRNYNLPVTRSSFITMGVNFSVTPTHVLAKVNILGERVEQGELAAAPLELEVNAGYEFQILLGKNSEETNINEMPETTLTEEPGKPEENEANEPGIQGIMKDLEKKDTTDNFAKPFVSYYNAIWDEFALYKKPSLEVIANDIISVSAEENNNSEQTND